MKINPQMTQMNADGCRKKERLWRVKGRKIFRPYLCEGYWIIFVGARHASPVFFCEDNMENNQQHFFELDVYGFTVVEDVLTTEEAGEMREALMRCEKEVGTESGTSGFCSACRQFAGAGSRFSQDD